MRTGTSHFHGLVSSDVKIRAYGRSRCLDIGDGITIFTDEQGDDGLTVLEDIGLSILQQVREIRGEV